MKKRIVEKPCDKCSTNTGVIATRTLQHEISGKIIIRRLIRCYSCGFTYYTIERRIPNRIISHGFMKGLKQWQEI